MDTTTNKHKPIILSPLSQDVKSAIFHENTSKQQWNVSIEDTTVPHLFSRSVPTTADTLLIAALVGNQAGLTGPLVPFSLV